MKEGAHLAFLSLGVIPNPHWAPWFLASFWPPHLNRHKEPLAGYSGPCWSTPQSSGELRPSCHTPRPEI